MIEASFNPMHTVHLAASDESEYGHHFGGVAEYDGVSFDVGSLHLLYRINLRDPALPPIPGQRADWLPLLFAFAFDYWDFGYIVESNDAVRLIGKRRPLRPQWAEAHPESFARTPVTAYRLSHDEHKTVVFAHVLQGADLGDFLVTDESDQAMLDEAGYPFTQLGGLHYLIQEINKPCTNGACGRYGSPTSLLATLWPEPVPGVRLFSDDYIQIAYWVCRGCGAIYTSSVCD